MRTAKKIFEEELSGEPLYQDAVISAIKIAMKEAINESTKVATASIIQTSANSGKRAIVNRNSILSLLKKL